MGGLVSLPPTASAPPRLGAHAGARGPSQAPQSLKGGSGPGSREAGLQSKRWKNLGDTGRSSGISTRGGTGKPHRRAPSYRAGSSREGGLQACAGHGPKPRACRWDRDSTHTAFPAHPPYPSVLRGLQQGRVSRPTACGSGAGRSEGTGSQVEKCVGQVGWEAECGGMAPTGWPSVVLKQRQEVIVTIARQVGGVQVRQELVRICEFGKEIQRRLRHVGCSLRSGLTL